MSALNVGTGSGLDGAPPRVALIGAKGCGKTIYRTYLHARAATELPDYVRSVLGLTQADLPLQGEVRTRRDGGWQWTLEGDLGQREAAGPYLPVVDATQHVTRHVLTLPRLEGEPLTAGRVYDFPGAYWEIEEAKPFIIEALRACRLVVLMVPYWVLVPKALRQRPSLLYRARRLRDGLDEPAIQREHGEREEALRHGTLKWLELVRTARRGAGAPGTLIVTFTMLHREWRHDLQAGTAVSNCVQRLRGLLTQPLLNLQHEPTRSGQRRADFLASFGAELRQAVHGLRQAANLRRALEQVHDACADYVATVEQIARGPEHEDEESLDVIHALRAVETESLPHSFRYAAINVVSERLAKKRALAPARQGDAEAFALVGPSAAVAPSYQRYLKLETAAAMLPSLHLCGSLD